ncbi:hypothetical protein ACE6H2_011851 [Prunus campanulata]
MRIIMILETHPKISSSTCHCHLSSEVSFGTIKCSNRVGWEPLTEPTCTTSANCKDCPHSTCTTTRDGKKKCLCNSNFKWNGLNCTQCENVMLDIKFCWKSIFFESQD